MRKAAELLVHFARPRRVPAAGPSGLGPGLDPNALPAGRPLPAGAALTRGPPANVPGSVLEDLLSALDSMLVATVEKWALREWESFVYLFIYITEDLCSLHYEKKIGEVQKRATGK